MTLHSLVIQKLLSTNAHIGRRLAAQHFKMYAYGMRNGLTIVDSDKTLICLRNACNFISHLARNNASIMFVNTNPLHQEIVDLMSSKISSLSPERSNSLWRMGGFLTNSFSPKKFRSRNKKVRFGPTQLPDCVVVFDTERKSSVVPEAYRLQIPIVALVDSNMPLDFYEKITYPVPANDSVQFVYLFCNMITKCFMLEEKKKKEDGVGLLGRKTRSREEAQPIEQSASESGEKDEVLLIPLDKLELLSQDIAKTKEILDKLVVVKFNGALGTTMGFSGPKSLIEIREGLTLLDVIIEQIQSLNAKYGCKVPLLLMNTNKTHDDTLKVLEKYSKSNIDIQSFIQGQQAEPESLGLHSVDDLYPSDPGTAFLSLVKSETLDLLLSQGKEYVLVVNSDNACAVIDPKILNHVTQKKIEYCMEVTPTTTSFSRTSVLSSQEGKFKLVHIAQNPSRHSTKKFKFMDAGSLWVNLKAIKRLVDTDAMKMEKLSTSKAVDPDDKESAVGSAIQLFDQAIGVNVPQSRYLPVNSTLDLLLLQSDIYTYDEGILARNRAINPSISLGPEFEKVSDFQSRFKSTPSIVGLDSLKVTGDVWFGADITLKGKVKIAAEPGEKLEIPDNVVIKNKDITNPSDILYNSDNDRE
ncbi:hypothetical protein SLEP1_g54172 [Rubroshorea leprosula]|uniref:UTP--glucose-1-phosphate uridylyltransferase n=1 Tax=Rubroshorea leprosula TaxID=152421 RepID=A0AAV5MBK5_9ROSI|nr:hypothetical protein SLEP1_g54172 [Rubroshorea leprosula]